MILYVPSTPRVETGINDTSASLGEFRNFELTNIHPEYKSWGKVILSALRTSAIALPYEHRKKLRNNFY